MLRTLVADLEQAGHRLVIPIKRELEAYGKFFRRSSTQIIPKNQSIESWIYKQSKFCDGAIVIAPETKTILQSIIEVVEETSLISFNSTSGAVKEVSDKYNVISLLAEKGISVPKSEFIRYGDNTHDLSFNSSMASLVIKPNRGAGCIGVHIVKNQSQFQETLHFLKHFGEKILVQEFILGTHASVSLLSNGKQAKAIALNMQYITEENGALSYLGGITPYPSKLEEQALTIAEKATEAFPGLHGYVGIDLMLTKEEPVVIEINPRLTTSYIGLHFVSNKNIAEPLVDTVINRVLPEQISTKQFCAYSPSKFQKQFPKGMIQVCPPLDSYRERLGFYAVRSQSFASARDSLQYLHSFL